MSPSEIQSTGHSGRQAPHAIHSSVILYANYLTPTNLSFLQFHFNRFKTILKALLKIFIYNLTIF